MNQRLRTLRIQAIILLALLAVQYALGMYADLFVSFPDGIQGGTAWEFAQQQPALVAHIILGLLLVIGAIVFLVRAIRYQSVAWKIPALCGFLGILVAAVSGAKFIPSQTDPYSYLMSLSFLVAFASYGWGLLAARREVQTSNL